MPSPHGALTRRAAVCLPESLTSLFAKFSACPSARWPCGRGSWNECPACQDGAIVGLVSTQGVHVLTPGQAYPGENVRKRGPIALLPLLHAASFGDLRITPNAAADQTEFGLTVRVTSPAPETNREATLYFRLRDYRITPMPP